MSLFKLGNFILHSGNRSSWKIDCDALTGGDWGTLAVMAQEKLLKRGLRFSYVIGIPQGGLPFAWELEKYSIPNYPVLIVDDVLTTGNSMERMRKHYPDAIGCVVFTRGKCPDWVTPLFQYWEEK